MAAKQTLGALIDALKTARDARIERQHEMDEELKELKATEADLKHKIINAMESSGQTSSTGKIATSTIKTDLIPRASDWSSIHKYIKKNDAFDLFERRLNKAAVKARLDDGETVPGIEFYEDKDLSLTKA